jgi:membrane protein
MNRCETSDSNNTKQKQKMEIKSITKQSIEALGDFLEYKEIKRVFSSLFSTNEKGFKELGAMLATIISLTTVIYWMIKTAYFALLTGKAYYYGFNWSDVYINSNFVHEIALSSFLILLLGILTILFLNIWIPKLNIIYKIFCTILLWGIEIAVSLLIISWDLYGFRINNFFEEIRGYTNQERILLGIVLIFFVVELNYYGIVISIITYRKQKRDNEIAIHNEKISNNGNIKHKILILIIISIVFITLIWLWGYFNEMTRTNYKIIEGSNSSNTVLNEQNVTGSKIECLGYVVILENENSYLCNKILCNKETKEWEIHTNSQIFIKKDSIEVLKIYNIHMNKCMWENEDLE